MKFNRRGRLNTSRVRDRRGGGGKMAIGGGIGGILFLLIAVVAGVDPSVLLQATEGGGGGQPPADGGLGACETGADIEQREECRFVAFENSVQDYWAAEFERRGAQYQPASFNVFTGGVSTACGSASSAMGPFYCPADQGVYLDIGFFQVLEERLGAQGGDFAEAYVVAHEFGHHVQNLTGQNDRVRTREGAASDAVRLELQADCLAGVWAANATQVDAAGGRSPIITEITREDIAEAIDAAETVGDDYIQSRSQGNVTPETWTHGSSEQRVAWFSRGLDAGDLDVCDTFAADAL
ncbi:MAG: neutral zinc metallopeptidase [Actinobacteria bacterium]|nr:neutral zinc metallopeptidase [Actinomycetota bacterium]